MAVATYGPQSCFSSTGSKDPNLLYQSERKPLTMSEEETVKRPFVVYQCGRKYLDQYDLLRMHNQQGRQQAREPV